MYMCTKNVKAVVKFQLTGFKIMCTANYDWLNRDQVQQDWGFTGYMCSAPSNFARIFVALYFLKSWPIFLSSLLCLFRK